MLGDDVLVVHGACPCPCCGEGLSNERLQGAGADSQDDGAAFQTRLSRKELQAATTMMAEVVHDELAS